jgi:response regulator RpfG family c-di-GMP phosphodiesterase
MSSGPSKLFLSIILRFMNFFTVFKNSDNLSRPRALLEFMAKSNIGRWGTTILIADDEPAILCATAMYLKDCGYHILTAADGEEAARVFAEAPHTIHLVISDVVMPGMRGPQLVRSIKNLSPSTATLLMSGTWTVVPEDGVALIAKPFTRQIFLAMVRSLLESCDFAKIEEEQSALRSKRLAAIHGTASRDSLVTD